LLQPVPVPFRKAPLMDTVRVSFNSQQIQLVERSIAEGVADNAVGVVRRALHEHNRADGGQTGSPSSTPIQPAVTDSPRSLRLTHVMEPGTGKALEVRAGQVLSVEQTTGPQCVDFNCFYLHDYKEVMHVGRMRAMYGLNPTKGDFIWSAPPRERAMMFILEDSAHCNDVMFSRCNAYLYESVYGFAAHTNCHDIQAEAQREYGLTPDDVHDSFNMFMCTDVTDGRLQIKRAPPRPPGHCERVELLALIDVLAVPNVCGNDVGRTSNFSLKPIKLSIFDASSADLAVVPKLHAFPHSQRTPAAFRQAAIKPDRPLRRDPSYLPQFANVPLTETVVEIALDAKEMALLEQTGLRPHYGADDGALLRDVVLSWWEKNFTSFLPGTD
jgi:uncharacterized protein YcgI (DUF1989 family)